MQTWSKVHRRSCMGRASATPRYLFYRAEKKSWQILLSRTQTEPGRKVKQDQEDISRNHVPRLFLGSLDFCRSLYVHSIEFDIPVQIRNVILKGNGKLSGKKMFSAGDMDVAALFERSQNKKFWYREAVESLMAKYLGRTRWFKNCTIATSWPSVDRVGWNLVDLWPLPRSTVHQRFSKIPNSSTDGQDVCLTQFGRKFTQTSL